MPTTIDAPATEAVETESSLPTGEAASELIDHVLGEGAEDPGVGGGGLRGLGRVLGLGAASAARAFSGLRYRIPTARASAGSR